MRTGKMQNRKQTMKEQRKIKIGIIGLGTIARVQQRALLLLPDLYDLTEGCDIAKEAERHCAAPRFYQNLQEFLLDGSAETVLISTPPQTHDAIAETCIRAGKNVLSEKPLSDHPADVCRLYRLAKEKGVFLRTAYHAVHSVEVKWFLSHREEIFARYGLSALRRIRCELHDPYLDHNHPLRDRIPLGGSWLDNGINALSVCARLTDLSGFSLTEKEDVRDKETNVVYRAKRKFQSADVSVEIYTAWDTGKNYKTTELTFGAGEGRILLNHTFQRVEFITDKGREILFDDEGQERLLRQYCGVFRDYRDAFLQGKSDENETVLLHKLLFS